MTDSWKGLLRDLFTLIVLIVVVVIPVRLFIISPFIVDGASMHPTFGHLDYLVVDELVYRFHAPERGDVIVFRYPGDLSTFYIKRIIGLPGERVSINHGVVTITTNTGATFPLDETYLVNEDATYTKNVTLRDGEFFVMGDNRPNSSDSRTWGPLPQEDIVGRVDLRLLPITKAGFLPGAAEYATPSFTEPSTATTTP